MNKVFKLKTYPECTQIYSDMDRVDYFDSYMIVKNTPGSVSEITQKLLKSPGWVNALGKLRDILVKPFGLKTEQLLLFSLHGFRRLSFISLKGPFRTPLLMV